MYPLPTEKREGRTQLCGCLTALPLLRSMFYVTRVSAPRGLEAGHAAHADVELLSPGINKEGLGWDGLTGLGWAGWAGLECGHLVTLD